MILFAPNARAQFLAHVMGISHWLCGITEVCSEGNRALISTIVQLIDGHNASEKGSNLKSCKENDKTIK